MEKRDFGNTGLQVTALGFGAGEIGDGRLPEIEAERVLNGVLDEGINLIDTARGYGLSEERIGRYISARRDEYVLSTKVGYGIEGFSDWTYDGLIAGVEYAMKLMKTDHIDIVHLHSCPKEKLADGSLADALDKLREQGKIKIGAYSGENEDLEFAVRSGRFQSVMASLNICDQKIIDDLLWDIKQRGMGFIAKRPVANAPWRFEDRPSGHYCEEYWVRWKAMNFGYPIAPLELALRFSAYTYGVDSCIAGTTNIHHIRENVRVLEEGKLSDVMVLQIRGAFRFFGENWFGQI